MSINKKLFVLKEWKSQNEYVFQNDIRKLIFHPEFEAIINANAKQISYKPEILALKEKGEISTLSEEEKELVMFEDRLEDITKEEDGILYTLSFGDALFEKYLTISEDSSIGSHNFKIKIPFIAGKQMSDFVTEMFVTNSEDAPIDVSELFSEPVVIDSKEVDTDKICTNTQLGSIVAVFLDNYYNLNEPGRAKYIGMFDPEGQNRWDDHYSRLSSVVSHDENKYKIKISLSDPLQLYRYNRTASSRIFVENGDYFIPTIYLNVPYKKADDIVDQDHPTTITPTNTDPLKDIPTERQELPGSSTTSTRRISEKTRP